MKPEESEVVCLKDIDSGQIERLLGAVGLKLVEVADGESIPASFWGEPEAGIRKTSLYARSDTPLHSILHEAGHFICMSPERRERLDTNAGGDYEEENAVCYLQILMADRIVGFGRDRCMADMDRWGYSFRLGSTRAWFEEDAEDAREGLVRRGILAQK